MSAALGAVLVAGVAPAHAPVAAAAGPGATQALTEEQQALRTAGETGKPVEVLGQRSEYTTTYANPDGRTFRLDQSTAPVRVKAGTGWVEPDATLEVRDDGSVGPKAAVTSLGFSKGGRDTRLATIGRGPHSLSLGWQGTLPAPVLDGANALYREVLPGVDLRLTATTEGFREVLVVKTPEAAKNPALKRITFPLKSAQLRLNGTKDGGLEALDGNGNRVFNAPPALMWDSRGQSTSKAASKAGVAASGKPSGQPEREDVPADAPGRGDRTAELAVHVAADALTLVPDAGLLGQTDPAAFPLYIDPSIALDNNVERTLLRNDGYEDYAWDNAEDGMGRGMGECGSWNGYYCGPGYVQRLYFEFSPTKLAGKEVLSSKFTITEPWAFQCDVRNVWLVRTAGEISSATTWANKPAYLDRMGDRWVSAGRGSACDPNSPTAPIEFADNPGEPDENLTPTVRDFAAGKFKRLTLELRAEDETDTASWKRFRNDAVLSVDYISKPALPSAIGIVAGSGQVCGTSESTASIVSDPTPLLTATAETVAGGEAGASLRVAMLTEKRQADGSYVPVRKLPTDSSFIDRPSTGYVGANVRLTGEPPVALEENALYRYRTWTRSFAGSELRGSPANTGCYFKVDAQAPKAPMITFNGPYSECTTSSCTAAGKPGQAGSFTFGATGGDTNKAYAYKLSTDSTWTEKPGSPLTVSVTPQTSGTMRLSVKAKDSLDRWGAENIVDFVVKEGPGPVGIWNFDEASGSALDTSTTDPALRNNATLGGGVARQDTGRRGWITTPTLHEDRTLRTDGVDDYAATAGPVIDTRASFTISTWVRPSETDQTFSVVGQAGTYMSAVSLSHHAGSTWSVRMPTSDTVNGSISDNVVLAKGPATRRVWTHLAASYNASTNKLKLYVNGQLQGEDTVSSPVAGLGPMSFGRIKYQGNWTDYLAGRVDEVKVWQDEKSALEIEQEAALFDPATGKNQVELSGAWNLSGLVNGEYSDTSGYDRDLVPDAGTTASGGAFVLNGTNQAATAAGPLVDDSGSFTVTAEAKLDSAKLLSKADNYKAQVIGQRTATGSSWSIWYEKTNNAEVSANDEDDPTKTVTKPVGRWHFGRLTSDGTGTSVVSEDLAALDTEVQVTGVYDALAGTITLYVGSSREGDPKAYTARVGSGEFAVGKGFTVSAWGHHLPGLIKDMRVWSGAMKDIAQVESDVLDGA
ncbi:LamG domain-containing protein [Streptomyces sp. NPDC101118]|uniref:LamG domain-containing protein n=1 Tax=Streptomyces sp. NPDC101118 TaxID=3366109 RepID=UPI0038213072